MFLRDYPVTIGPLSGGRPAWRERPAGSLGLPVFDIGLLLVTFQGYWRLLLFRWLVHLDGSGPQYLPMLWLEPIPDDNGGLYLMLLLSAPPWCPLGYLRAVLPLNLEAVREIGPWRLEAHTWPRGEEE